MHPTSTCGKLGESKVVRRRRFIRTDSPFSQQVASTRYAHTHTYIYALKPHGRPLLHLLRLEGA